jgi:hypothetical protein
VPSLAKQKISGGWLPQPDGAPQPGVGAPAAPGGAPPADSSLPGAAGMCPCDEAQRQPCKGLSPGRGNLSGEYFRVRCRPLLGPSLS